MTLYLWTPEDTQREAKLKPWETNGSDLTTAELDALALKAERARLVRVQAERGAGLRRDELRRENYLFGVVGAAIAIALAAAYGNAPPQVVYAVLGGGACLALLLGWAWWLGRGR